MAAVSRFPSPLPYPPRARRLAWIAAVCALAAANLTLQAFLHRGGIDNAVVNARNPTAHDAREYVRAAEVLARGGTLAEACGSGWRMPGYSLALAALHRLSAEPLRAARVAQILLTASLAAFFCAMLARATSSRRRALLGGALAAAWLPLYHFSAMLYAEAASLFLVTVLLFVLARLDRPEATGRGATADKAPSLLFTGSLAGLLVAALAYLKPNHVLLLLPVAGFLALGEGPPRRRAAGAAAAVIVTLALLTPWSAFISRATGTFTPFTTSSGYNLYLGTGRPPLAREPGSLPDRVARAIGLRGDSADLPDGRALEGSRNGQAYAAWDASLAQRARAIWSERPGAVALHGGAKILHAFGFSLRDARDALLALFFLASVAASALLARHGNRNEKRWVLFLGLSLFVVALQAFVYLPNQRFKTVLFDPPALLVLVLGASVAWDRLRGKPGDRPRRGGETNAGARPAQGPPPL